MKEMSNFNFIDLIYERFIIEVQVTYRNNYTKITLYHKSYNCIDIFETG